MCFINDLPSVVHSQTRLFADNCLLYQPIKSMQDQLKLQEDLHRLESWASTWGMCFNVQKCYILRISRSKTPLQHFYELNHHILKELDKCPYLDIMISNDLTFSMHINNTITKANRQLGFLRRNLHHCPKQLKETAYISLICSS